MNPNTLPLPDNRERQRILHDLDINLLVEAAAGTGKTTCLISRMIALIREGKCRIDTLAAVTFTRKAAVEMRSRFQIELENEIRDSSGTIHRRLVEALNRMERCFLGTIHSFCARLLRERPVEANVDIAFREIDEIEDRLFRREAWDDYVGGLYATGHPILRELSEVGLEIGTLYPIFQRMADYPDVEEWPASRIELPDLAPARQVLVEYVEHMKNLLPTLPKDAGSDTLIPKYRQLSRILDYHDLSQPARFMEILDEFSKTKVTQKNWPGKKEQALREQERWDAFRVRFVEPLQNNWFAYRYEIGLRAILPACRDYETKKREQGVLNYQDLLVKTARLLKRWPSVRRYFQKRITHLLVDEFQDTDPIQAEVMMLLTSEDPANPDWQTCSLRRGSLFVVGDPKQSIYRFRRADMVTYNQVKEIIQTQGGKVLHLTANFRSDPVIVDWINQVFREQFPDTDSSYSPRYVDLEWGKPQEGICDDDKILRLTIPDSFQNKEDCLRYEPELIAKTINREIGERGAKPDDFLIVTGLTRNLSVYARQLQSYHIPFQVTGGDGLRQVEEFHWLTLCLEAVIHPTNPIALVSVLRSELFGLSDPELYEFKKSGGVFSFLETVPKSLSPDLFTRYQDIFDRLHLYRDWLENLAIATALEKIANHLGLFASASAHLGGEIHCGSLAKAISLIRSSPEQFRTHRDVLHFFHDICIGQITMEGISANPPQKSVVRIMNLHKVKGLQAPVVFLADPTGQYVFEPEIHIDRSQSIARGYMKMEWKREGSWGKPILLAQPLDWETWAKEEQNFLDAEKIRLLYVAATRPEKQLIVSQREKGNSNNPWGFFNSFLTERGSIHTFPDRQPDPEQPMLLDRDRFHSYVKKLDLQRDRILHASYAVLAAKDAISEHKIEGKTREEGTQWGQLIHTLLETSLRKSSASLESIASGLMKDRTINPEWISGAIRMVRKVQSSDIWKRARQSESCYVEMPFQIQDDPLIPLADPVSLPTIHRGVIDLVFKENKGWVIVDFKTDLASRENIDSLMEKYRAQIRIYASAWVAMTGEPVHEAGFFFTEINQFRSVDFTP